MLFNCFQRWAAAAMSALACDRGYQLPDGRLGSTFSRSRT